jgi:hypothetical protein
VLIDSLPPLRYNALDQLVCVLCNVHVKSEILWSTHLQSKRHKECVNALKASKSAPPNTVTSSSKSSSVGPVVSADEPMMDRTAAALPGVAQAAAAVGKRKHEVRLMYLLRGFHGTGDY